MKVVVITGASGGIGEALAREALKRGYQVALVARRKDELDRLCAELGEHTLAVQGDVSVDGDMERAIGQTIERFGRIDMVIANAGMGVIGRFDQLTLSDWQRQFEVNWFGVLRTAYASLEALKKTKGSFGVVGSVAGFFHAPGGAAYAASKAVVRNFCYSLRAELARDGVSVTHIAPGFIESQIRLRNNKGELGTDIKDPVPKWLVMPASVAARQMMTAMERRRREIIVTFHGKLAARIASWFPFLIDLGYRMAAPNKPV